MGEREGHARGEDVGSQQGIGGGRCTVVFEPSDHRGVGEARLVPEHRQRRCKSGRGIAEARHPHS